MAATQYTVTLVYPLGNYKETAYFNVYLAGTKTLATIYETTALGTALTQPVAIPSTNIVTFALSGPTGIDLQVFGGNVSNAFTIGNVNSYSSTIWDLDPVLWQNNPELWTAVNPYAIDGTVVGNARSVANVGQLYTGSSLVHSAMRLIQVSAQDTDLTASELQDGIEVLNRMIDQWGVEELMLYQVTRESFSSVANQQMYTIGNGGDFDTIRPTKIIGAYFTLSNGSLPVDYPINILGWDDFNAIRLKTLTTNFPMYLYYQPDFPLGKIYIYPLFASSAESLTLTSWKPLGLISDPAATIELPPGYWDAIVFNLAVRMAEEYQFDIRPQTAAIAQNGLRLIKRMNQRVTTLQTDPALMTRNQRRYNVYSDSWGSGS